MEYNLWVKIRVFVAYGLFAKWVKSLYSKKKPTLVHKCQKISLGFDSFQALPLDLVRWRYLSCNAAFVEVRCERAPTNRQRRKLWAKTRWLYHQCLGWHSLFINNICPVSWSFFLECLTQVQIISVGYLLVTPLRSPSPTSIHCFYMMKSLPGWNTVCP